jgi:hypothetical protein
LPRVYILAAAALLLTAVQTSAQSITFDFESGGDQGWGNKFSNDASAAFPIVNIAGSNRMEVLRNGDFQEAERASTGATDPFLIAINAATANPSGYVISYDWHIDTSRSPGNYGNFLQVGTYMNAGSGAFAQDFPGAGKDVELNGAQLASGEVFSGTVSETLTQKYGALDAGFLGQTFMRLGMIMNGDGTAATVYFDNISIRPIPEPASLALFALAAPAMFMLRRRR